MADKVDPLCTDPHISDPALLRNHSDFKSFKTSHAEYKDIRVFFRQHAKAAELYTNGPLPLLVFLPGLGGSVAQFHPLLNSLVDLAPCLSMDYPGMGRSKFDLTSWEAYTTEAMGELFETIIEDYRDKEAEQTVVLVGHSMGTAHAAWLANRKVKHTTRLADYVVGVIGICPVGGAMNESLVRWARRLIWVPGWLFDLWRTWDGIGGPESPSVLRFVGEDAEPELKLLQYRFNRQSRTPVWRRMFYGALPTYKDGKPVGGVTGLDVWAGLEVPVYLVAGEKDTLTPPSEVDKILEAMELKKTGNGSDQLQTDELIVDTAAPVSTSTRPQDHVPQHISDIREEDFQKKTFRSNSPNGHPDPFEDCSTPNDTTQADLPLQPRHPKKVVQSIVLPAPATHALLYMPSSVRALAGLISDFLASNVTGRLSLGWQLQYLSREGKWDVKNLNKWKSVEPVSEAIGPEGKPIFHGLKTLREADDFHCPKEFVASWGGVIKDIVDISKDQPVYDPRGLERAGVHYHKFPTVSKVPPTAAEVEDFIKLIDKLRLDRPEEHLIGVHCHYGFNRTGYFIVCYLVERCDMSVQDAIALFARKRGSNGIRHSHFKDRLYVRYSVDRRE